MIPGDFERGAPAAGRRALAASLERGPAVGMLAAASSCQGAARRPRGRIGEPSYGVAAHVRADAAPAAGGPAPSPSLGDVRCIGISVERSRCSVAPSEGGAAFLKPERTSCDFHHLPHARSCRRREWTGPVRVGEERRRGRRLRCGRARALPTVRRPHVNVLSHVSPDVSNG